MSAAHCYLTPAKGRANLRIVTGAVVERVTLDGGRCTGVVYRQGGGPAIEVEAGCEVILAAGGIASPQVLELSGIGRPDILKAQGIAVRHGLDGVGENLRDHINARIQWEVLRADLSYNTRMHGLGKVREALRYAIDRGDF